MNTTLLGTRMKTLRWFAPAVGAVLLLIGIGFLVMPELLATGILEAEPARAVGINSLRDNVGGLFLGMGLCVLIGTLARHPMLLLVPIVALDLIVTGRVVSRAKPVKLMRDIPPRRRHTQIDALRYRLDRPVARADKRSGA